MIFKNVPSQLEKVQEFVEELKASDESNFQLAGANLQEIVKEKVCTYTSVYTHACNSSNSEAEHRIRVFGPAKLVICQNKGMYGRSCCCAIIRAQPLEMNLV